MQPYPGSFGVAGIEVTQAIQDMDHTVPLIAGKPTLVRVYLSDRLSPPALDVWGEIEITGPHGTIIVGSPDPVCLDPARHVQLQAARLDLAASLNFALPQRINQAGKYTIRVKRVHTRSSSDLVDTTPDVSRPVHFIYAAPLRLHVIIFRHKGGYPQRTHKPRQLDYYLLVSWLRRAFPVPTVIVSRVTTNANPVWQGHLDFSRDINAQITAIRASDMDNGMDPLTHYLGMLSDGEGLTPVTGLASSFGEDDIAAVACAPAGVPTGNWAWDTDGSYGDWYGAHELAHTFGRRHIGHCDNQNADDPNYPYDDGLISGPCGEFVGVDVGDTTVKLVPRRVYSGAQSHDVMSYCDYIWLSDYTYRGVMQRINDEAAGFAP